ncbi:hypothetical protein ACFC6L_23350 [Kitasatospora phosalacinea]|uniref:hypothetical protein n=1 Tax=Kitasatospora phosalacinea TaxID=2065 RepID=UPI0035DAC9D9
MHGTGTIYQRCGCRDPLTGRQRGSTCPGPKQRGHGSRYLALPQPATAAHALARLRDPELVRSGALMSCAQWLGRWYATVEPHLRASTARGYRRHLRQYLVPLLGRELPCELTHDRVQQAFDTIVRRHQDAGRPISGNTLRRIQATLRAALNAAIRRGFLTTDPARHLDLPRTPRPVVWTDARVAVWTPAQTATFPARTGGCDLKVIQAQLGHSTIITTADTYTSVLPQTAPDSAENTAKVITDAARTMSRSIRHRRVKPRSAAHAAIKTPFAA